MHIKIPEPLQSKSWFIEKHLSDVNHPLFDSVVKLILFSDFACRHIQLLKSLLMEDKCDFMLSREDYFCAVHNISHELSQSNYLHALRQFRNKHFLRLLLLELSSKVKTEEIMCAWSDCADALILHALGYCKQTLSVHYGTPRDKTGIEVELYTLAMGKLGGRELNYSSDVDLIFAYATAGETDGEECIDNQLFFNKLIQQFVYVFQHSTVDGFVFRVDLRLRPYGDSGPLVSSFASMETYYQEQGRNWERYAMVKARVISESLVKVPSWFVQLITPFVYRRYVDFSVIESLRSMKAMIEGEISLNPRLDDIKRGKGGIREVEFIIQSFQLIRGGRLPQLQEQNALAALFVLKKEKLVPYSDVLKQAYLFLRRLENMLQSVSDQQSHSVPQDFIKQEQITLAMGYSSWSDLMNQLNQYQRMVRYVFHSILGKVEYYEDEKRVLANQLMNLWQGHVEYNMAISLLSSLGFINAPHCYQMICSFHHSSRCRRLSQGARMYLDRFMVILLTELTHVEKTDEILLQVMHLLENIVGRSTYLALLAENPQILPELLFWFAHSPFITALLVNQPFLLEVLLAQEQKWRPLSLNQLQERLVEKLSHQSDMELQEEALRQFKLTYWLMAARAELYGFCNAVRIGQFLSDVAQVIVNQILLLATRQLGLRYPNMEKIKSHFAVIAYGKLGSREMNYASDLDLVFLHSATSSEETLITRLTQKILHMLTTRFQSGILYPVDTRLRPSGASGLLVSHIDAFVTYQKTQAWTWESQALLKARILTGNVKIKRTFVQLKKSIILLARDKSILLHDIMSMRAKMEQYQERNFISEGLLDLEFLVQFLILNSGDPSCSRLTHTLNQLHHLFSAGILSATHYILLKKAYKKYHHLLHQSVLRSDVMSDKRMNEQIAVIYREFFNN